MLFLVPSSFAAPMIIALSILDGMKYLAFFPLLPAEPTTIIPAATALLITSSRTALFSDA